MTWLYVPGTSSPSAAEPEDSSSESEPPRPGVACWVTSSGMPLLRPSSWRGWKTRPWIVLLSGTTLPPSEATSCVRSWIESTCSRQASAASHGAPPARDSAPRTSVGSGPRSTASFARWDPGSSSWKTCRPSLFGEDSLSSSETWPRRGSMLSGVVTALLKRERHTVGSGSSFLDGEFPTPTARDARTDQDRARQGSASLGHLVWSGQLTWASPQARDGKGGFSGHTKSGRDLSNDVERWPTPTAGDSRSSGGRNASPNAHPGTSLTDAACYDGGHSRRSRPDPMETGPESPPNSIPRLNPAFVEWLMGWPAPGWTEPLQPLRALTASVFAGTGLCLRRQPSRSPSS